MFGVDYDSPFNTLITRITLYASVNRLWTVITLYTEGSCRRSLGVEAILFIDRVCERAGFGKETCVNCREMITPHRRICIRVK